MKNTLTTSSNIWKKAENLFELKKIERKDIYTVPYFISIWIDDYNIWNIKEDFINKGIRFVSVRSSSDTEDTENNSNAWAFKTLLNIDINEVEYAIKDVQKHATKKFWYKIPIIIQEMVNNIHRSWVAFSIDPDTWKDYSILNYHSWIWEDLVSWNVDWNIVKIFNNSNEEYISDVFHKKLFLAIKYIKKELSMWEIDIEFCYDWEKLYLLQVRPITKISLTNKSSIHTVNRYVNFVHKIFSTRNNIYWDMIDVNPEELIWNDSIVSQTYFEEIFTKSSLLQAREELWYCKWENFLTFLLNKPYVDLEKNIITFLPSTLTEIEIQIFISYYRKLLENNPLTQNKLDSELYPNDVEKVIAILSNENVSEEIKDSILNKFSEFFWKLNDKFIDYTSKYREIEKGFLSQFNLDIDCLYELLLKNEYNWTIQDLLSLIKKMTYYFTIFARIFFFLSNKKNEENHDFFNEFIYSQQINDVMFAFDIPQTEYKLPKWFDFTYLLEQKLFVDRYNKWKTGIKYELWNLIDIAKVARENLKFIFMNATRILWIKINKELIKKWRNINDVRNVTFETLISYINWDISEKKLELEILKWQRKASFSKILDLPSVISKKQSLLDREILSEKWFFVWKDVLKWKICIINNIEEFDIKDYKNKIIVIQNATPEIDIYLPFIKWIITKNWWPLAHIMIRAREMNIPAVVWSSYYDELFNNDDSEISIDFNKEKIDLI